MSIACRGPARCQQPCSMLDACPIWFVVQDGWLVACVASTSRWLLAPKGHTSVAWHMQASLHNVPLLSALVLLPSITPLGARAHISMTSFNSPPVVVHVCMHFPSTPYPGSPLMTHASPLNPLP